MLVDLANSKRPTLLTSQARPPRSSTQGCRHWEPPWSRPLPLRNWPSPSLRCDAGIDSDTRLVLKRTSSYGTPRRSRARPRLFCLPWSCPQGRTGGEGCTGLHFWNMSWLRAPEIDFCKTKICCIIEIACSNLKISTAHFVKMLVSSKVWLWYKLWAETSVNAMSS